MCMLHFSTHIHTHTLTHSPRTDLVRFTSDTTPCGCDIAFLHVVGSVCLVIICSFSSSFFLFPIIGHSLRSSAHFRPPALDQSYPFLSGLWVVSGVLLVEALLRFYDRNLLTHGTQAKQHRVQWQREREGRLGKVKRTFASSFFNNVMFGVFGMCIVCVCVSLVSMCLMCFFVVFVNL